MMKEGEHLFPFMKLLKNENEVIKYCEEYLRTNKNYDDYWYELDKKETP